MDSFDDISDQSDLSDDDIDCKIVVYGLFSRESKQVKHNIGVCHRAK